MLHINITVISGSFAQTIILPGLFVSAFHINDLCETVVILFYLMSAFFHFTIIEIDFLTIVLSYIDIRLVLHKT